VSRYASILTLCLCLCPPCPAMLALTAHQLPSTTWSGIHLCTYSHISNHESTSPLSMVLLCVIPLVTTFNRGPVYYTLQLPTSSDTTLTIQTSYNHLTVPKPATLPQEAANQGMYWERDLLAGSQLALATDGVQLPAESVKIRVK